MTVSMQSLVSSLLPLHLLCLLSQECTQAEQLGVSMGSRVSVCAAEETDG